MTCASVASLGLVVVLLSACIAESSHSGPRAAAELKVDERVTLTIGASNASEAKQFYRIRGVVRMDDGRIVVADGGSNEIRFYAPDGAHIRTVGGEGEGPGEFKMLYWLKRTRSDSLVAWDQELSRVTVMDPEGMAVRTFRIAPDAEFPISVPEQIFPDGSVLSMAGPPNEEMDSTGKGYWTVVSLTRTGSNGENLGRVALVKQQRCPDRGCARQFRLFRAAWAAAPSSLYYYRPDQSVLEVLNLEDRSMIAFPLDGIRAPSDTVPAVTTIVADDRDDLIWLNTASGEWRALDPTGEPRASVTPPEAFKVHEVTLTYILGVAKDSIGIEYVRLLSLTNQ